SSSPPHAAAVSASTAEAAKTSHHFLFIESLLFRLSKGGRLHRAAPPRIPYRRWTLSAGSAEVVTWVWRSCKKDVNALLRTPGECGLGLRREAVADAGVGVDEAAAGQRPLELGPQPPHIHVDGAVALSVGASPDPLVELIAGHHPLGVVGELGEQLQLAHGQ